MNNELKQFGKNAFSLIGAISLMNELNFRFQQIWKFKKNNTYQAPKKRFVFPTDRALFNTFQLDLKKYYEDGLLAAKEIIDWSLISKIKKPIILDWGCGTGRVIRHIPDIQKEASCYGVDIDCDGIYWCKKNIESVYFDCIENQCLPYPSNYFNLVYGISVLTHIHHQETNYWVNEIKRVLEPNGVAIITTHGSQYFYQLNQLQIKQLEQEGAFSNNFKHQGDRLLTTYHSANHLKVTLEEYFTIQQYWAGKEFPQKMGGQDCWIIRKK
jgi:ubiquinone/menaquinone biosynthesis C-methylase UbiE